MFFNTVLSKQRIVFVGLGLIGASWAKALKKACPTLTIVGVDRNERSMEYAKQHDVVDEYTVHLSDAVTSADVIVLAVPILSMKAVLGAVAPHLREHTIITDVGSVKRTLIEASEDIFHCKYPNLVLGHPIAGSEKSGVTAANETLFENQNVIITPHENNNSEAVEVVRAMWRIVGANVMEMPIYHHDDVLAATSHLPHLLAFSLVDTLAKDDENREIFKYAAGGFRDFTRIAASDPVMWHDIFQANKAATLTVLDKFLDNLALLRTAIETQDSNTMLGVFTRAKSARDHFSKILAQRAYIETMSTQDVTFIAQPGGEVKGEIRVPGDKSCSHRSIMLGSLAEGVTEVEGFLEGEDALATLQAFRDMGVVIEGPVDGRVVIHGVGLHGLQAPPGPLYVGNSGTTIRLLSGLLAAQKFDVTITGDESLSKRPMGRVADPLAKMGAVIETSENGRPPLTIRGGQSLKGIDYTLPMASAQVKSCLMLAGLYAEGKTTVTEPAPTRDHTERMLVGFGYPVEANNGVISVEGGGKLKAMKIEVPSDISSAAFFMVAASISPNADLTLKHVGMNPTRVGVINILKAMGGNLIISNERIVGGEPVADVRIQYAPLKGIDIPEDQVPLAIDEFPVLFVAAACAEGTTVLRGAEELRVKESDRIQVMVDGLKTLGVNAEPTPDGIVIVGGSIGGGEVHSHHDHRIAMAFSVASLRATDTIIVHDCANVATSFPNFVELAQIVGMNVSIK